MVIHCNMVYPFLNKKLSASRFAYIVKKSLIEKIGL